MTNPFSFLSGFVQDRGVGRVIAQVDEIVEAGATASRLMKWVKNDQKWYSFRLDWTATRMWVLTQPELQVFAIGPYGIVSIGTLKGNTEEEIDGGNDGRHFRDLRYIGEHLYAAGMGRKVFRREGPNHWVRRDQGVVLPQGDMTIAGFNSIDGLEEADFYAVGFGGEIWRCVQGKWRQVDSPTNVVLHRVRGVSKDKMLACGQMGVVLVGSGDSWKPLKHGLTEEDLWGLEWYRDRFWLASERALYRTTDDGVDLEEVDIGLGEDWSFSHLHANDGVMWSFGTKHVCWTEDGVKWNDVTP